MGSRGVGQGVLIVSAVREDCILFAYPAPRHARFTEDEVSAKTEERYAALYRKLSNLVLATTRTAIQTPNR